MTEPGESPIHVYREGPPEPPADKGEAIMHGVIGLAFGFVSGLGIGLWRGANGVALALIVGIVTLACAAGAAKFGNRFWNWVGGTKPWV